MRKASQTMLAAMVLMLITSTVYPQGIQSTIINLPLTGNWKQAAEIEKETIAPGVQVFFDQATGTVLQIRQDYQIRAVTEISQQFSNAGKAMTSQEAAQILMKSMFPLPSKYSQAISATLHEGRSPKMWEVKDPGNAQWFYVSQLFGGYRVIGGSKSSEIREEFMPMRVTHAEHHNAGGGDALIFEAETERAAPEIAIKRFQMPGTVKDQRLRYGWIQFSPGGITSGESIISLAFATPVSSNFDVSGVLEQMVKNYVQKVQN